MVHARASVWVCLHGFSCEQLYVYAVQNGLQLYRTAHAALALPGVTLCTHAPCGLGAHAAHRIAACHGTPRCPCRLLRMVAAAKTAVPAQPTLRNGGRGPQQRLCAAAAAVAVLACAADGARPSHSHGAATVAAEAPLGIREAARHGSEPACISMGFARRICRHGAQRPRHETQMGSVGACVRMCVYGSTHPRSLARCLPSPE